MLSVAVFVDVAVVALVVIAFGVENAKTTDNSSRTKLVPIIERRETTAINRR